MLDLNSLFAFETGVWVPTKNEIRFTSLIYTGLLYLLILNLNTSKIYKPTLSQLLLNQNSGYYFKKRYTRRHKGIRRTLVGFIL